MDEEGVVMREHWYDSHWCLLIAGCITIIAAWFVIFSLFSCSAPTPPPDEGMPWPTGQGAA